MNHLTVETEDAFASLLELAANNDVEGFKKWIEQDPSCIDEIGLWYSRQKGSKQMVNIHRTPLLVASAYGCVDVMRLILSISRVDVNCRCGVDKSTALHCAASGGAVNAVESVYLLLASGADPNLVDGNGNRPVDVIVVPPKLQDVKTALEELLKTDDSVGEQNLRANSDSPLLSSSPENGSPSSASNSTSSPMMLKLDDLSGPLPSEKREYPIDPSLPDIKNGIYSTDEFRMYSFKVRPCSRAYSHDWTECPFVHPGENARRRDPRKYHYSCVPCPDFRKGACRRGDMCEYAHGVFECWLHPAQYRTRLCKDGNGCARRVCFFAHAPEELRPLYVSTGSAVLSPRSSASAASAMDYASFLPGGSSSSVPVMSPSSFTPPMSPSGNGHSPVPWSQPNVPTLHLPGSNFQSSRLRSSLNARDIPTDDFTMLRDFDMQQQHQQLVKELSLSSNSLNRSGRFKTLTPSNLDDLFSAEGMSPRYVDQQMASASVFSPTHKSAMFNQFQQQQTVLSPINTSFSPKNADNNSFLSSGRMSPRNMDPISPMSARMSMLAHREQFRSLSSRELGSNSNSNPIVGSPVNSWSKWGYSNGKPDWAVGNDELGNLRRSSSFGLGNNGEEPDISWVQSLVKESPTENKEGVETDQVGAWLEQMQLERFVGQQNGKH